MDPVADRVTRQTAAITGHQQCQLTQQTSPPQLLMATGQIRLQATQHHLWQRHAQFTPRLATIDNAGIARLLGLFVCALGIIVMPAAAV